MGRHESSKKTRRLRVAYIVAGLFITLLVGMSLIYGERAEAGVATAPCSKTADAALRACRSETDDEYWINLGNCYNITDTDARTACEQDAQANAKESKDECAEQHDARLGVCEAIGEAAYDPVIDPSQFVDPENIGGSVAENAYVPLKQGRSWRYENSEEVNTVTVLDETREVLGVKCAVVHDVVALNGEVTEDTLDWYAQDVAGNVWYMGEISKEIEDGQLVSIEGSWTSGVDSAKPGIVMKANPVPGETYRQEFFLGDAEDIGAVQQIDGSATVSAASCIGDCVVTNDYTPLEPDVLEHKYYAFGIGFILEVDLETGERIELVEYHN